MKESKPRSRSCSCLRALQCVLTLGYTVRFLSQVVRSYDSRPTGSDGINDDERLYQVFLYMRDPLNSSELDSNHYAFPLPISPVLDCNKYKVIRIDHLPTGADNTIKNNIEPYRHKPANEYIHEAQELRKDVKPLNVIQPEGASFTVTPVGETGNVIAWQKWTFRVGE